MSLTSDATRTMPKQETLINLTPNYQTNNFETIKNDSTDLKPIDDKNDSKDRAINSTNNIKIIDNNTLTDIKPKEKSTDSNFEKVEIQESNIFKNAKYTSFVNKFLN